LLLENIDPGIRGQIITVDFKDSSPPIIILKNLPLRLKILMNPACYKFVSNMQITALSLFLLMG
jgi:hypothetical protein